MTEPQKAKASGATEADATNQSTSTEIIGSTADQRKRWANLQARAALAGITTHRYDSQDGREKYLAARWSLSREFESLEALELWLADVKGGRDA